MTVKLKNTLQKTLREIVAATQEGSFAYTSEAVYEKLTEHGFVEINPEIKDEFGDIATRATEAGIAYVSEFLSGDTLPLDLESATPVSIGERADALVLESIANNPAKFAAAVEKGVPMPEKKRAGAKHGAKFPFDALEVEDSFLIKATESKPEPWKSYASTVSNATRSYAVVDSSGEMVMNKKGEEVPKLVKTRKFVIREVEEVNTESGEIVVGARVWRVV